MLEDLHWMRWREAAGDRGQADLGGNHEVRSVNEFEGLEMTGKVIRTIREDERVERRAECNGQGG